MKRNIDNLNLRNAFRQEPERCHTALLHAARSVKEDTNVKHAPLRIVLITLLIIAAMTAAALAADSAGLVDWSHFCWDDYANDDYATSVPVAPDPDRFIVGPITFTIKNKFADGRIAYLLVEARVTYGIPSVLYMRDADPNDQIGETLAAVLDTDGITATTSFAEAAQIAGIPLYSVSARLEPEGDVLAGEEMMNAVWQQDGSVLLIDMLYTDPDVVGDALPITIRLKAAEYDSETLARKDYSYDWQTTDTRTLAVSGIIAEKTYAPSSADKLYDCLAVTQVTAEQTSAGIYVTIALTADDGVSLETVLSNDGLYVLDAQGNAFPVGLSMTAEYLYGDGTRLLYDSNPSQITPSTLQYRLMIGANTLPDTMIVTDGTTEVVVQ